MSPSDGDYAVIAHGRLLLTISGGGLPTIGQCRAQGVPLESAVLAAHVEGVGYWGVSCWPASLPASWQETPVRSLLHAFSCEPCMALTRAIELAIWRNEHRFCGRCGQPTALNGDDGSLQCVACGFKSFPRLSPAMIVRITRDHGSEILLARNRNFLRPVFSNISGFVESGEGFEECVRREVMEEVGVQVRNIRYFGSQNWPFPHSLLAAFTAEYAGGQVRPDGEEIVEAAWFRRDGQLPPFPEPGSISRQLIDDFLMEP